jgi:hypothetical protein
MRLGMLLVVAGAVAFAPACGVYDYDDTPRLGSTAQGLKRYASLTAAAADGYVVDMMPRHSDYFVPGKGIEISNPKHVVLDADKPQSLLYEFGITKCFRLECPDEGYVLVGARYTAPATGPVPELFGQKFSGPVGNPPVYELYSWIKDNPNGKFASTHPNLYAPSWWPEHFRVWRALADRYPTPDAAVAGGYQFMFAERPDGTLADCVYDRLPRKRPGAMGYHYQKNGAVSTDPASVSPVNPQGLLYFEKEDHTWILGGVEYLLWAARQPIPNIYGESFDGPMAGHQATQPEHFDLHAYPGYLNPDGVFSTWNMAAACPLSK